ncbi:MAG: hypothetical protein MJH09_07300 [Cetobacterium sp.]|nr:hypothetical protein [Cetobacterium sp.]
MICIFEDEEHYLKELSKNNIEQLKNMKSQEEGIGYYYTRDPFTGTKALVGEYTLNGHFKDIHLLNLDNEFLYKELLELGKIKEKDLKDMVKISFSIKNNEIEILEVSQGERTAKAAIKMSIDFVEDEILTIAESLDRIREVRISPKFLEKLEVENAKSKTSRTVDESFKNLYLDGLKKNLKRLLFWADAYKVNIFEAYEG